MPLGWKCSIITNSSPLVSIGLPIYNRPLSFKKALDSLLSQTYKNIEINIGDNSENNESEKIFEEYHHDNRIKYYKHEKNIGASANFMFVSDMANGKYFMWAADDDYWDSTFIEKAVEKLENDPETVACWPQVQFFNDNGVMNNLPPSFYNQDLSDDSIISRLLKLNLQAGWFEFYCLVKTDIVKEFQFGSYKTIGTDVIYLNYLLLSGKCLMIDEPLFHYCYTYEKSGVYEKHKYKADVYNEYARINPALDMFVKCFQLVLNSKKLNPFEKIHYYLEYWLKVLSPRQVWVNQFRRFSIIKFFNLAIKYKDIYVIIICIPLLFFLSFILLSLRSKEFIRKFIKI